MKAYKKRAKGGWNSGKYRKQWSNREERQYEKKEIREGEQEWLEGDDYRHSAPKSKVELPPKVKRIQWKLHHNRWIEKMRRTYPNWLPWRFGGWNNEYESIELSKKDWEKLQEEMKNPSQPSKALKKAFKAFEEEFGDKIKIKD